MMNYLSAEREVALVFMLPELSQRIAEMLNHFLRELVGPKCAELKVKDSAEKYHFAPKQLLHEIVTILLHFAAFPEFAHAMIRDERSFDQGNLRKAVRVLGRSTTDLSVRPEHLQALEAFASKCVELKEELGQEEDDLGEIPDEYIDPITQVHSNITATAAAQASSTPFNNTLALLTHPPPSRYPLITRTGTDGGSSQAAFGQPYG